MKNFIPLFLIIFLLLTGCASTGSQWEDTLGNVFNTTGKDQLSKVLSNDEISQAFKQALSIGSKNVVSKLGAIDGFNTDPAIHIPLPKKLNTVKKILEKVGMSQIVDDLELKLNRAAENATPKAKKLFLQSIKEMTFNDVQGIYKGPKDSATRYFKEKMTPSLIDEMRPLIEDSISQVGAIQAFDNMMEKYQMIPFVPNVKADLTDHVIQKGIDGIFHYIAKEEAAIRKDPLKQTTKLLKRVFRTED